MSGFGYKELSSYYINDIKSGNNMEMGEVIKVTVYCNFEFQSFPFDEQECDLSLYDEINDMKFTILEEKYLLHYRGNLTHYDGKEWTILPYQHGIPYVIKMKSLGPANLTFDGIYEPQSILTIRFSLKRNSFGLLIGSFYLPTGLFAFLSMGSYIIDPEIVSTQYILHNHISNLKSKHSLIRGVLMQSCSAGAKKFTNYIFCHPQFSGVIQNIENCCGIRAKF